MGTGLVAPQLFAAGGSPVVSRFFWVITGGPWYPGYRAPTVSRGASVVWVAGAIHSMGGRIGTHMLLRVPPRNSVVR
jgi:hypothetical protein